MVNTVTQSLAQYQASEDADADVCAYLRSSFAENTLKAYQSDLRDFAAWGGQLPETPARVAKYLATRAENLSCSSLSRRAVAIGRAHTMNGLLSPTHSELVKATLRGIRRSKTVCQRAVGALQKEDLVNMLRDAQGVRGLRDKALLLTGFAAALRRSELVSLDVEDVLFTPEGTLIRLRRGKTDQMGQGRVIAIPYVKGRYCPSRVLQTWLETAGLTSGPLFMRVNRYDQVMRKRLTSQSVALIIKERAAAAGLDPAQYSGHSLRAGFATNAARAGVSAIGIRSQTGHSSDAMLQRYIRDADPFNEHPLLKVWR